MTVYLYDAIAGLLSFAGNVDLVLSDLPSGETQAEFDKAPDLAALFSATWHALKPDGIAVFMASSLRFAAACMAAGGKAYRYDLVWEKSIATGHMQAKTRPMRAHEFVLVFAHGAHCYAPQMVEAGVKPSGMSRPSKSENYGSIARADYEKRRETTRYPQSVLRIKSVPNCPGSGRVHPQQKPDDLLRWLVRSYSRPGETVVDPYAGSGTTERAALAEGRRAIVWDSSPRFGANP